MGSQPQQAWRNSVPQIAKMKGGTPIMALTSYHAHTAAIVDRFADFPLVGDSLGMVMHGMTSTVSVPLDLMALIVVAMPFGSFEKSPNMAFRNAAMVMKETG